MVLEYCAERTDARFDLLAGRIFKPVQEYPNRAKFDRAVAGVGYEDHLPRQSMVLLVFLNDAQVQLCTPVSLKCRGHVTIVRK